MDENHEEANFKEFIYIMQHLSPREGYYLIRQMLTEREFNDIAKRWEIAKLLNQGTTQRKIASDLQVSLCKITRGSRELKRPNSAMKKAVEIQAGLASGDTQEQSN